MQGKVSLRLENSSLFLLEGWEELPLSKGNTTIHQQDKGKSFHDQNRTKWGWKPSNPKLSLETVKGLPQKGKLGKDAPLSGNTHPDPEIPPFSSPLSQVQPDQPLDASYTQFLLSSSSRKSSAFCRVQITSRRPSLESQPKSSCFAISTERSVPRHPKHVSHLVLFLLFSCLVMSDSVTPWTAARQASLSFTGSRSLLKLMSIESVMPSNHLVPCCPFLLLPSILPSIRVFSSESILCIKWPKYWSFGFSISPSNKWSGLISFRIDWLDLPAVQGTLKSLL